MPGLSPLSFAPDTAHHRDAGSYHCFAVIRLIFSPQVYPGGLFSVIPTFPLVMPDLIRHPVFSVPLPLLSYLRALRVLRGKILSSFLYHQRHQRNQRLIILSSSSLIPASRDHGKFFLFISSLRASARTARMYTALIVRLLAEFPAIPEKKLDKQSPK